MATQPPGFAPKAAPKNEDGTISMVLFRQFGPDVSLVEYKQRLEMIAEDCHCLLQLETSNFWKVVTYDRSVLRSIDSFLRFSPRHSFEFDGLPNDEELQKQLLSAHRLVFLVVLRLATNKDTGSKSSKDKLRDAFLSSSEFGQLIYDRHIWTLPMLFDTVALFGHKNGLLLSRMLHSLFSAQPKFTDDLSSAFVATEQALRQLSFQLDNLSLVNSHDDSALWSQLADMIIFAFDTFSTLENFFKLYQPAAYVIEECCNTLLPYCAEFFDSTLQALIKQVSNLCSKLAGQESTIYLSGDCLLRIAAATEVRIANTFHAVVSATCLSSPDHIHPEQYFNILTTAAGQHHFLWLLDQLHPLVEDIRFLEKHSHEVDLSCKNYITAALQEARRLHEPTKTKAQSPKLKAIASGGPSQKEIESMVNSVRIVMGSTFDRKFIATCLERFDYNPDVLVQMMLDNNLPPDLQPGGDDDNVNEDNVDDGYEYTSENIEAALSSVHIGKRDTELEASEIKEMKPFFDKFTNMVSVKTPVPAGKTPADWVNVSVPEMEYDDEYDDTYDDHEVAMPSGPQGAPGDIMLRRRGFTVPRVLAASSRRNAHEWETVDSEEDEEEEKQEVNASQPSRDQNASTSGPSSYRGGYKGGQDSGRGTTSANIKNGVDAEGSSERPAGPRVGDTRGFKGASRDRHKLESAASRGGNNQRPSNDYSGGPRDGSDHRARPLATETSRNDSRNERVREGAEHNNTDVITREQLPEDVARMKKERHKGSVGNHNRRDLAARKRREF